MQVKAQKRWHEFLPKSWVALKENYSPQTFRKDLMAGITVGIVSLPLAMAFAIASGVDPEKGIFTAIVAGFLISLLGGSKVQIGGPTGAFVVVIYGIVMRLGYEGLLMATLMAAILLVLMGLLRLGSWIKFVPYPLITGFTTGIAVVIFSSQIKDFLGLKIDQLPVDFLLKWKAIFSALATWDPITCTVACGSLGLIILIRRFVPVIPWGVGSIVIATAACWAFSLPVETVADRFGEIPRALPCPSFPSFDFNIESIRSLVPDALTIALLAAIESLLSAVIADGMMGGRHKPNCELIAQGVANLGAALFGGIPATGAIARTAINIKTGAKTPVAGMVHAITILCLIFALAPVVGKIPLAALSAVLVMVAWNMSELDHFRHLFKAPSGDVAILLTAFLLTILVDITVAVEVGMVLAAFLFMKRMGERSGVITHGIFKEDVQAEGSENDPDAISNKEVPAGVEVYEVDGPLFFGVADTLKDLLHDVVFPPKVFILRMRKVPVIDASGLHALAELYKKCQRDHTVLILSGVKGQPARHLKKFGLEEVIGKENIFPHIDLALQRTREIIHQRELASLQML
jgi:SulP family sulfate permease